VPATASDITPPTGVLAELDAARAQIDVLEHPFYLRWRAGGLRADELELYARQYRHAVLALAQASTRAAEEAPADAAAELQAHAREEAAHVALWDRFAAATAAAVAPNGAAGDATPSP
jgi:pyrroloquinoline quinone (PQQ) biosynthesis protein C